MHADARLIRSVFLQAVEAHRPDEWEAYLDEACAGDAALRERVEILLRAHSQSNSLLDTPAAGLPVTIDAWPWP